MVDKVGFLITTTPGDWIDYSKAFTDVWVGKLKHPANSIVRGPSGGAKGVKQAIIDAVRDFRDNQPDVKVVVTAGTMAAQVCKSELTTMPFIYASVGDPALSGLSPVANGNYTGGSNRQADEDVVKARVDYMLDNGFQEPFAILGNDSNHNEPFETAMNHAYNYLTTLGRVVQKQTITPQDSIPAIINALKAQAQPVQSLYVCSDPYLTVNSKLLNDTAHQNGTPYINTMFEIQEHKNKHGGNAYFGSDFLDLFAKAAYYAHEIVSKTSTPGKLPVYFAPLSGGGGAAAFMKAKKKKKKAKKKK